MQSFVSRERWRQGRVINRWIRTGVLYGRLVITGLSSLLCCSPIYQALLMTLLHVIFYLLQQWWSNRREASGCSSAALYQKHPTQRWFPPVSPLFICFISTGKPGFVRKGNIFSQSGWAHKVIFGLSANLLTSSKPKAFQKSKATVSEQVLLSTVCETENPLDQRQPQSINGKTFPPLVPN